MAASVRALVVCCSVLFWVLLSPTPFQVTAAPFSNKAAIIQPGSHSDASSASRNLERDIVWQRRKKRYKKYPVAEPGGYDENSERLRDWDNKHFPGQNDYFRSKIGPRGQYDPSGYRGDNSYQEYAGGRDARYEEFKKSQLWKQSQRGPNSYNRRIEVPQKKVQPNRPIDTGSNTLYQPERIGVPKHVAGFWGDSPNGNNPTLKEKGILQTLAKAERSGFHKIRPGSIKKVSTQFDFTEKTDENLPTNGRPDGRYPQEQGKYPFEYDRQQSRDQNIYQDAPYQGPQSQYRHPNELPGSYNHPNIGNMLGQNEHGVKKGAPVDGMLLNLHEAPGLVPVPKKHEPESADQASSAAHEPPHQGSAQQAISADVALNTTGTSKKEFEIPMPPKSKTWLDMHPEKIRGPSTTPASTAAPTTTKLAIPMPPKSKAWLEEQRLQEEMKHMEEEKEVIERLEEVSHRLETNKTSGGNSSRYITEQEQTGSRQPDVGRQAVLDDTGGAGDNSRVYLTREEYERLQQQAQLQQQRESMLEEQRAQRSHLPAASHVEEQDKSTNQVQEDAHDVQEDAHDVQEDAHDVQEDAHDVHEDAHDVQEDAHDVQEDAHDVQEDAHDVQEDAHDVQEDTEDVQEDAHDVQEDAHDAQEDAHDAQEDAQDEVVNNTADGTESIKRDPTPEDIEQLRQAELERERQSMFKELEEDRSEISSESQQNNETQTVTQLEEGSQEVTANKTGSERESLKQEELANTRQNELEKEREQMLEELEKEEGEALGNDQSETKTEQKESEGLQAMAEAWEKMNSSKRRKKRSVPDQHSDHQAANYGKSARSGTGGKAGGAVNAGVAPKNDIVVNGQKVAMPAKRGNSYMKETGKHGSFPVHEVQTDRLGVPKSVAGFWEDTKKDEDIAADKAPSSSLKHMKVTLNKANPPQHKASAANLPSNVRKLTDTKFYKSKGINRLEGRSKYKKTPFEDDSSPVGRLSPFKDNAKPETKTLPLHQKYPVPPSLPIKENHETREKVAPEKIVSFESGVDDVPVPLKRQKVVIHNAVQRPSQRRHEYTSDEILAAKERLLPNTLQQKVALAKSHAVNHYRTDHAYVQENQLVKSSEKLTNESSSSSNETDIAYQFLKPEFYNNIIARYKSKDALWAALCLAIVLFVMFSAVWYSKMWRKKAGDWDIPGKYQPEAASIPIKELIRQKLGRIPRLKVKLKRKRKGPIGHRYLQLKRKQTGGTSSEGEEEVMYKRL